MDRRSAEIKRAEMTEKRDRERQAQLAVGAARDMEAERRKEPRVFLTDAGAFLNLVLVARVLGAGRRLSSREGRSTADVPVHLMEGQECVSASDLERACDSGMFGIGAVGHVQIIRAMTLADVDMWTQVDLGFRPAPVSHMADNPLDLRRWLEAGGDQGGRVDVEIAARYAKGRDLAGILPAEIGLDWGRRSLLYIRALSAEPDGAALTTGAVAATGPGPAPAPARMRDADEDLDGDD